MKEPDNTAYDPRSRARTYGYAAAATGIGTLAIATVQPYLIPAGMLAGTFLLERWASNSVKADDLESRVDNA